MHSPAFSSVIPPIADHRHRNCAANRRELLHALRLAEFRFRRRRKDRTKKNVVGSIAHGSLRAFERMARSSNQKISARRDRELRSRTMIANDDAETRIDSPTSQRPQRANLLRRDERRQRLPRSPHPTRSLTMIRLPFEPRCATPKSLLASMPPARRAGKSFSRICTQSTPAAAIAAIFSTSAESATAAAGNGKTPPVRHVAQNRNFAIDHRRAPATVGEHSRMGQRRCLRS